MERRRALVRMVGLLLALLGPTALLPGSAGQGHHAPPAEPWVQPDPASDGPGGAAAAPYTDIVAVQIADEDPIGFWLGIATRAFGPPTTAPPAELPPGAQFGRDRIDFDVDFGVSTLEQTYRIQMFATGYAGPGQGGLGFSPETMQAYLYTNTPGLNCPLVPTFDDRPEGCLAEPLSVRFDADADLFEVWLAKRWLAGLRSDSEVASSSPARPPESVELGPGASITDLVVSIRHNLPTGILNPAPLETDRAPDTGTLPPYGFAQPMANVRVALTLADAVFSLQTVPGRTQTYLLAATNHLTEPRHLSLEYWASRGSVRDEAIGVRGVDSLFVPPKQTRHLPVIIDVPADLPYGDTFHVEVFASSRESSIDHAHFRSPVAVSHYLGPEHPVLHVHAFADPRQYRLAGRFGGETAPAAQDAACGGDATATDCHDAALSPNMEEAGADPAAYVRGGYATWEPGTGYPCFEGSCAGFQVPTLRPGPLGLRTDESRPTRMQFALSAAQDVGPVRVQAQLVASERETQALGSEFQELAWANAEVDLGTAVTLVSLSDEQTGGVEVPMGSMMRLYLNVYGAVPTNQPNLVEQVMLHARDSWIELPLLPTEHDLKAAAESPFWLFVDGSTQREVNPGEATLFRVGLMNLGDREASVELDATVSPGTAPARIHPGTRFRVAPGDGVTLGIEVRAPSGASAGDVVTVLLQATDDVDAVVEQRLAALVVEGDVADESGTFLADPDDEGKKIRADGTPMIGALAGMAAVGAAALMRARRD